MAHRAVKVGPFSAVSRARTVNANWLLRFRRPLKRYSGQGDVLYTPAVASIATEGFSFDFCCRLLGREPVDVLQRVQNYFFPPTGMPISGVSYAEPLSYFLK